MDAVIHEMQPEDWVAVRDIYEAGMATGNATFETAVPDWAAWDAAHRVDCRLVARKEGNVIGWAALSPVSSRCVYGGVAEVSVYVAVAARGTGVGTALLQSLVAASEAAGIWTLEAGILPENEASIALHKTCGFRVVGVRERLGRLHGQWQDVVLMEKRSKRVGQ